MRIVYISEIIYNFKDSIQPVRPNYISNAQYFPISVDLNLEKGNKYGEWIPRTYYASDVTANKTE